MGRIASAGRYLPRWGTEPFKKSGVLWGDARGLWDCDGLPEPTFRGGIGDVVKSGHPADPRVFSCRKRHELDTAVVEAEYQKTFSVSGADEMFFNHARIVHSGNELHRQGHFAGAVSRSVEVKQFHAPYRFEIPKTDIFIHAPVSADSGRGQKGGPDPGTDEGMPQEDCFHAHFQSFTNFGKYAGFDSRRGTVISTMFSLPNIDDFLRNTK